ncbi:7-carboxy-7-deazaguanine synthase QueE [Desulfogranum japonicum]|uniref:7-carboxy-7-deazaguanine synthase QueE n=1 Tax=Desulfogranum japonicum TaxID=231447 RepID=UPI001E46AAD6|nr:7-carboxy-7-deazaguanine synthase QueE [Desulfogranum japonicum]
MGKPAHFLRLAGCVEPFCPQCDTRHALQGGESMSVTALCEALRSGPDTVVITGGEPFFQWNNGLEELCHVLEEKGKRLQYETSGRVEIPEKVPGYIVCSPKPMGRPYLTLNMVTRCHAFKFVVDANVQPTLDIITRWNLPPEKVWLMPMGMSRQEQLKLMPFVWEVACEYGYNFSPRLHIVAFDQKQGV